MCPESLHVYRRMGVAEHERLIKQASVTSVDLIQTTNAPKVFLDQGFAEMVDEVAGPRSQASQRAYEEAMRAALDPFHREKANEQAGPSRGTGTPAQATPAKPKTAKAAAAPMAAQAEDARPGQGVKSRLPEGTRVAVPRALWPDDECNEMGGEAWHATVISSTGLTAVVEFAKARSKSGHAYKDVRLPLCALRLIA